jgi:hypothetical protein
MRVHLPIQNGPENCARSRRRVHIRTASAEENHAFETFEISGALGTMTKVFMDHAAFCRSDAHIKFHLHIPLYPAAHALIGMSPRGNHSVNEMHNHRKRFAAGFLYGTHRYEIGLFSSPFGHNI